MNHTTSPTILITGASRRHGRALTRELAQTRVDAHH